jgi:hypothetical protein
MKRELLDIFLNQKNVSHFCQEIVFDLIDNLKPTPPPSPDFSKLEIRKELFTKKNSHKNYHFDLFIDRYGTNLFRNCLRILNILQNKEVYRPNPKELLNVNTVESEKLQKKVTIENTYVKETNKDSIILEKNSRQNSSKQAFGGNFLQEKNNITSNMVTFNEVANDEAIDEYPSINPNQKMLIPCKDIINEIYNSDPPGQYLDYFWDMDFGSIDTLKMQILENCEEYSEEDAFEISESINSRIRILEDLCLVKKPDSSILFKYLKKELLGYFDIVMEEVDRKREELDLPAFHGEGEQPSNDPQLNKEKVGSCGF